MNFVTWCIIISGLVAAICFVCGWCGSRSFYLSSHQPEPKIEESESLFCNLEVMVGNVLYRTEGATVLARCKRPGLVDEPCEEYLMKTPNGNYFLQVHHHYEMLGLQSSIWPYDRPQAIRTYNTMPDKLVSFEEAFGLKIVDA